MKNKTFAKVAAPAAIPPNPKKAAIIANNNNPADQRNIQYDLRFKNVLLFVTMINTMPLQYRFIRRLKNQVAGIFIHSKGKRGNAYGMFFIIII